MEGAWETGDRWRASARDGLTRWASVTGSDATQLEFARTDTVYPDTATGAATFHCQIQIRSQHRDQTSPGPAHLLSKRKPESRNGRRRFTVHDPYTYASPASHSDADPGPLISCHSPGRVLLPTATRRTVLPINTPSSLSPAPSPLPVLPLLLLSPFPSPPSRTRHGRLVQRVRLSPGQGRTDSLHPTRPRCQSRRRRGTPHRREGDCARARGGCKDQVRTPSRFRVRSECSQTLPRRKIDLHLMPLMCGECRDHTTSCSY